MSAKIAAVCAVLRLNAATFRLQCRIELVGFLLLPALICAPAFAHWKPQYVGSDAAIQKWYSEQQNGNGDYCCDRADGHAYFGDYTMNKDGSVTIGKRTIPATKVLKGPNPTGHAIWWYEQDQSGHYDYCFIPGTLG